MSRKTFETFLIVALVVRMAWIWVPQMWYDENFTLILARLPFDQMMTAIKGDVHPPLWYLIEWAFIRIMPDPMTAPAWTLRLPSVAFSLWALWVFRELLDELRIPARIQMGAMVLAVILPMQLWYAQEARMYALLLVEVLLALLCTIRGQWVRLFLVSAAMLYTQNYAAFYLACIGLVSLVMDIRSMPLMQDFKTLSLQAKASMVFGPTLKTAAAMITAFVAYIPWLRVLAYQMNYIGGRYWIQQPLIGDMLYTVYKLFWQSAMPGFALISGVTITFMALSVGIMHITHSRHAATWTVMIMGFGPLLLAWIVSIFWNPVLLHRALIGSSVFLYIVVAWPVDALLQKASMTDGSQRAPVLSHWRELVIALAMVVPILFSGVAGYYKNIPGMKNDGAVSSLQDAMEYVRAHWQPGDVLYFTDDGPAVNLLPYTADLPRFGMAVCGEKSYGLVLGSLNPRTREAMGIIVKRFDELRDYKRVWVFAPRSPLHPKCYEEQIAPITPGEPIITVDDNVFIWSGVWLVEAQ